eukprot:scaffold160000_cov31-Prasinocladus_malaysianus.AAC.1
MSKLLPRCLSTELNVPLWPQFMTRSEFSLLVAALGDARDDIDMPTPAVIKPMELFTGKQLFSMLVRPNAKTRVFVNLETSEKIYEKKDKEMCNSDGYVVFRNRHDKLKR